MANPEENAGSIKKDYVRFLNCTGETITVRHFTKIGEIGRFDLEEGQYIDKLVVTPQTYERFQVIDSSRKKTNAVIKAEELVGNEKVIFRKISGTFDYEIVQRPGMVSSFVAKCKRVLGGGNAGGGNAGDGNAGDGNAGDRSAGGGLADVV